MRYEVLAQYIAAPITEESRTTFMQTCNFPLQMIQRINQKVQELKNDETLLALIAKFYDAFLAAL
jgi:hypothetical protein